jgi:hypothetical protein
MRKIEMNLSKIETIYKRYFNGEGIGWINTIGSTIGYILLIS